MAKISHSPPAIREDAKEKKKVFQDGIRQEVLRWEADSDAKRMLLALCGIKGHPEAMLASDAPLTHRAAIILENWLLAQRDELPNRTFYHATFVDQSFNTVDTEPVVPVTRIRKRVVRLISNAGLSGLVRIEVAPLVNHKASYGRPLLWHAHALVWTDDEFDHQGWSDRLNNSRHWNCSFGAKPILIEPLDDGILDAQRLAHYIFKLPEVAKFFKRERGYNVMLGVKQSYRGYFRMRVLECLSKIEFCDTIAGIGQGTDLRQYIREKIRDWHNRRGGYRLSRSDYSAYEFWKEINDDYAIKRYKNRPAIIQ